MSNKKHVLIALKKRLEPQLRDRSFLGKYPHYQRMQTNQLHLLSIVHDQYGGGFVLEFACMEAGPLETSWGDVIPPASLEIAYAPPEARARLVQTTRSQGLYENFFRYDRDGLTAADCEQLVAQVVKLLPQVEEWLANNITGPNIVPFGSCRS